MHKKPPSDLRTLKKRMKADDWRFEKHGSNHEIWIHEYSGAKMTVPRKAIEAFDAVTTDKKKVTKAKAKPDNMFTTAEAAALIGTTKKSLQEMRQRGRGPMWCKIGARVYYAPEAIEEFQAFIDFHGSNGRWPAKTDAPWASINGGEKWTPTFLDRKPVDTSHLKTKVKVKPEAMEKEQEELEKTVAQKAAEALRESENRKGKALANIGTTKDRANLEDYQSLGKSLEEAKKDRAIRTAAFDVVVAAIGESLSDEMRDAIRELAKLII